MRSQRAYQTLRRPHLRQLSGVRAQIARDHFDLGHIRVEPGILILRQRIPGRRSKMLSPQRRSLMIVERLPRYGRALPSSAYYKESQQGDERN